MEAGANLTVNNSMLVIRGRLSELDDPVDITVDDGGRISGIEPADATRHADAGSGSCLIAPGFIDIQLNGFQGIDFNDPHSTAESLARTPQALARTGVTGFCPTVITASGETMTACISKIVETCERSDEFAAAVAGIHIEGPYISPEDGPRGAHPREHVRPPDRDEFRHWQEIAQGRIRIVTISPEWPGAIDFIEWAADEGCVVAIGHTGATPEAIRAAVDAGAKLSTHLGNGSHARIERHPNYIWEQLADDRLRASFIFDGHHLPPSVVKCFIRAKGIERSILVTDAIAAAGLPAGKYRLGETEVEVTPERRVCLPGTPYLAGSVLEMHEAVANTVRFSDATIAGALKMATVNPARLLGITEADGPIATGRQADLAVIDWDQERCTVEITATVANGKIVYRRIC